MITKQSMQVQKLLFIIIVKYNAAEAAELSIFWTCKWMSQRSITRCSIQMTKSLACKPDTSILESSASIRFSPPYLYKHQHPTQTRLNLKTRPSNILLKTSILERHNKLQNFFRRVKITVNRQEMQRPEGYPSDEQDLPEMSSIVSDMEKKSPFLGRDDDDDFSLLESGLYRRSYSDMGDNHRRIQERAKRLGKSFDPRLLILLEFFRQFYVRRQELLKKIFPALQNEFMEISRKVGRVLAEVKPNQVKVKTVQRSLSLGSPRTPSKKGDESPLRLERFKIRTVNVGLGDDQPDGQGGNNPAGSK